MPALGELEGAWLEARQDAASRPSSRAAARLRGRPDSAVPRERTERGAGREVWLKREDLNHTGSHKINNAIGQALLAKRMGKPRVIAETGAGQHGVASATACALLDLECVVFMGARTSAASCPTCSA
jgi:tryptophan synthase beta chain